MTDREDQHWLGLAELATADQRRRISELAMSKRMRSKLVSMFHHKLQFEQSYIVNIGKKGTEQEVICLLEKHGATKEALVLNNNNDGNGEWKTVIDAISDCFGWGSGSIVSCVPGSLLFHESDEPELRNVIFKPVRKI